MTSPCTEKQVSFIATLINDRVNDTTDPAIVRKIADARGKVMSRTFSKAEASSLIGDLLTLPKNIKGAVFEAAAKHGSEPADGIYIVRGNGQFYSEAQVFKVYKMVHGSGRQGVKVLEIVDGEGGKNKGVFKYLGLAVKHLPANAEKMGLEEAKTFGQLYGFCVKCGATLTDETSIANGIGPICSGKDW